jgi:hypothetical protein
LVHQNCFSSLSPKSWAAPHDTSLISIDVTHRRDGQGRGDICLSLFFLLFWSLGWGINRPSSLLPSSCCLYTFKSLCTPLAAWCLVTGAAHGGHGWPAGTGKVEELAYLSIMDSCVMASLHCLPRILSCYGLWAFAFSGTTVPDGDISDISAYDHRLRCYSNPRRCSHMRWTL